MRRKFASFILPIILFFMIGNMAMGESFTYIDILVNPDNSITAVINARSDYDFISLMLPYDAEVVDFSVDGTPSLSACKEERKVDGTLINCSVENGSFITLKFTSSDAVMMSGDELLFLMRLIFYQNYDVCKIKLTLPENYIIASNEHAEPLIIPSPYQLYTAGNNQIVLWNVKCGENALVELFVAGKRASKFSVPLYVAIPIAAIALIVISFFFLRKRKHPDIFDKFLVRDEKMIIDLLKNKKEMKQKEIVRATGFSKAKVSRLLRNLEMRGVVVREKVGNACIVKLKEEEEE